MKKWNYPQINVYGLVLTGLITVGVKFSLCPICLQYHSYQRAYFNLPWCKLPLYCFTQSRAVVDWSTTQ